MAQENKAPGLRLHPRTRDVSRAQHALGSALDAFREQHGLTDVEMLIGVTEWCQRVFRDFLRAGRHPEDPCKKADET